jgi:hypothetical protein
MRLVGRSVVALDELLAIGGGEPQRDRPVAVEEAEHVAVERRVRQGLALPLHAGARGDETLVALH